MWQIKTFEVGIGNYQDHDRTDYEQELLPAGVAVHHAGINPADRVAIEQAFLAGYIGILCCTSTLAVGVNLPCHFVIIKNTVTWSDKGMKEYSDLEIMQMLGRAGRPQYDTSAIAVIMTRQEKKQRYERMVSGEEVIESWYDDRELR